MEKVTVACPGRNITLDTYNDPGFNCAGQIERYNRSRLNCEKAISYYHRTCAGDIDRPNLSVTKCKQASEPLTIANDTVTSEDKNMLDISRAYSKVSSGDSWSYSQTLQKAGSAAVIEQ